MRDVAILPASAVLIGAAAAVCVAWPGAIGAVEIWKVVAIVGWIALGLGVWAQWTLASARLSVRCVELAVVPSRTRRRRYHPLQVFGNPRWTIGSALCGFAGVGGTLGAFDAIHARHPSLLATLARLQEDPTTCGQQPLELTGTQRPADASTNQPTSCDIVVDLEGRVRGDAAISEFGVTFTLNAQELHTATVSVARMWPVAGTLRVTVGGRRAQEQIDDWRDGRRIRAAIAVRAPLPYRNFGVTDARERLAMSGLTLFGSIKTPALVQIVAPGRWWEERAADTRAWIRHTIARDVGRARGSLADPATDAEGKRPTVMSAADAARAQSAAIVIAVLIGDRAGLSPNVEHRLQRAGTYHVIAISGGNIAILTGTLLLLFRLARAPPRLRLFLTASSIVCYALTISAGPSIVRATVAAVTYLVAKAMDLEARSLTVLSTVVLLMLSASPLDIVSAGFWLTCGATLGILLHAAPMMRRIHEWRSPASPEVNVDARMRPALAPVLLVMPAVMAIAATAARRCLAGLRSVMEILAALVITTMAAELLLLPITAIAFSQITVAGLVLNIAAIPLMTIVQLAGMLTLVASSVPPCAALCGTIAHVAAVALVRSADLVDLAPWTVMRVAPPPLWLVCAYFLAWAGLWIPRVPTRLRIASGAVWIGCLALIAIAPPLPSMPSLPVAAPPCDSIPIPGAWRTRDWLRLTMIDVGQGAAAIVQVSEAQASRAVTDHAVEETMLVDAGGTMSEGFDVGGRVVSPALWALGIRRLSIIALTHGDIDHIGGAPVVIDDFHPRELWLGDWLAAGDRPAFGAARVEVWSPSDREPAAARTGSRGRNDHSLVMEIRLGDVSIVLPGDISAEVERRIVDRSGPAPFRVLLAPHHGSRSSSSDLFLDALAPRVVLVSAGLGNRHGHPSPVVLDRYRARGITVFRTDLDGAVQLLTDGHDVRIKACAGREIRDAASNGERIEDVGPAVARLRRPHRPQSGAAR